ncbi:MAG: MFS transporter [Clostridia bacterium]|nr:MFS transporter [Clostridia bacterium]
MKTKLSPRFLAALTIFSLMGQIAWVVENMYFNVFIYKMFNASAGDISLMVAASAVAATLTTVFMGALSDKIGKRKLFICGGYILWGISIFCFVFLRSDILNKIIPATVSAATVGISLTIALDCIMTFFGSTANDAAFNAWLTDSTDSTNRGAAEGINAMMPLVAILAVFGGFMGFDLGKSKDWSIIFAIIGAATLLVGILGFFIIKEPDIRPSGNGYFSSIFYGFKPSTVAKNKSLYFPLAVFVIFNIAIQIFMPYLILYYEVSLGMADYVLIMAPAIILASIVTAFWGRFYDKKGFKTSSVIAVLWLIVGFIILGLFKSTVLVFIGSLLMMCGYLSGMAVFGAVIRDNTPEGKVGSLQGIRIFAQVLIPGVIGPFIGKTVLANAETVQNNDGTFSFVPNQNIFFAALVAAVIVLILVVVFAKKSNPKTVLLTTEFEENLPEIPYNEHPRPQMKRENFLSLNGKWDFRVIGKKKEIYSGEIKVPFPPESRISGVGKSFKKDDLLVYEREFTLPESFKNKQVFLTFDAVDQHLSVFLNGKILGKNSGGYLPAEFEITDLLNWGKNHLLVQITDKTDSELPYGKQRINRGGMWYTPISGIWQSVWLEARPKKYIKDLKIIADLDKVTFKVDGGESSKTLEIETKDAKITKEFSGNEFTLKIENPINWTPENPYLYYFTLTSGEDKISSYFALRTVKSKKVGKYTYMALNGKPYFWNGLLDQGYFSDGIYIPATPEGYKNDILSMKKLGFNMLRKHIKIEPQIFYYYCDLYGMAVFQDMVNSGKYSFFIDTALPTVGLKAGIRHKATKQRKYFFETAAKQLVSHLYNHPSVVQYTIFNEGWGQYDDERIYNELKSLDPTRLYDTASGWFRPRKSDFQSEHIYFKPVKLTPSPKKVLFLSEFGGYSYKIKEHSFNLDKTYGYKKFEDSEAFKSAMKKLYKDEILPAVSKGLSATVLTQVSDVEDETNGILTYDRRVQKLEESDLKLVFDEIYKEFYKIHNNEGER